ncbi:MAG: M61 family metallopeptidase [Idiomarina sp.]|nr:M61 family metallopeptidase [Idiomarina sp.]
MSSPVIHYHVFASEPHHHYFDVTLEITDPDPNGQLLRLPAWIPGSYMIRDFARHIVEFEASCDKTAVTYTRPDKSTWQLEPCQGSIFVKYRVYAFDNSIRAAYLDHTYGFFNASSLCLEVVGQSYLPCLLNLHPPTDPFLSKWRTATGLHKDKVDERGFGCYRASDYAELVDTPVLLGELTQATFEVNNTPHHLVLAGKHYANLQKIIEDLTKICTEQQALFGEAPDFEEYYFLTIVTTDGYGGLEHHNSTALMCARESLETIESKRSPAYLDFLSLCSHEYFHNWNVKRLKPKEFIPYQLTHETYTDQLWFYEGMTSYYDDLMVLRAGIMTQEEYLVALGKLISRALRGAGPARQSLVESSTLAWTTFYQQNENAQNAISSYYSKGAVVALLIDLMIREASNGKESLDDVFRALWESYGKNLKGTTVDDLINALARTDEIRNFLQTALYQPNELPWRHWLEKSGLTIDMAASDPITMQPGPAGAEQIVGLGAVFSEQPDGMQIQRVFEHSAIANAGLSAKDTLVAVDNIKCTAKTLKLLQQRFQPGDRVIVHFFRDEQLFNRELTFAVPIRDNIQLSLTEVHSEVKPETKNAQAITWAPWHNL